MSDRWFIETSEGSGFILPIGANCQEQSSIYEKNEGTPFWAVDNPPLVLRFTGVATNQNASPTQGQVQSAMQDFYDFCSANKKITAVKLCEVTGSSNPMGGALGSAPGSLIQKYDPAFTDSGWEAVDFGAFDIVERQNFSFRLVLANLYPNSAGQQETIDVGGLLDGGGFHEERTISGGMVRTVISASMKLRKRSQVQTALSVAISMAKGTDINLATVFQRGETALPADKQLVAAGQSVLGSNIESVSVSYDPVTLDFTCAVAAVRPTTRSSTFATISGMSVTGTVDIDRGLVYTPLKGFQAFTGLVFQRSGPVVVALDMNIRLIAFRVNGHKITRGQVDAVLAKMDFGPFVDMGGGWARSTGSITGTGGDGANAESANVWTRNLHFVAGEQAVPADRTRGAGDVDLEQKALEILDGVSLAVMLGDSGALDDGLQAFGAGNNG